jgi:hypothetical protein
MVLSHHPPIGRLIEHMAEGAAGSPNQFGPQLLGIHTQQLIKLELNLLPRRPESRLVGLGNARKVEKHILPKLIRLDEADVLGGNDRSYSTYAHRRCLGVGAESGTAYTRQRHTRPAFS